MFKRTTYLLVLAFIILITGCKKEQNSQSAEENAYKQKLISLIKLEKSAAQPSGSEKGPLNFKSFKEAFLYFEKIRKEPMKMSDTLASISPDKKVTGGNTAGRSLDDSYRNVPYESSSYGRLMDVSRFGEPATLDVRCTAAPLVVYAYDETNGYGIYQLHNMYFDNMVNVYSGVGSCYETGSPFLGSTYYQQNLQQNFSVVIEGVTYSATATILVYVTGSVYASVPSATVPMIMCIVEFNVSLLP